MFRNDACVYNCDCVVGYVQYLPNARILVFFLPCVLYGYIHLHEKFSLLVCVCNYVTVCWIIRTCSSYLMYQYVPYARIILLVQPLAYTIHEHSNALQFSFIFLLWYNVLCLGSLKHNNAGILASMKAGSRISVTLSAKVQ